MVKCLNRLVAMGWMDPLLLLKAGAGLWLVAAVASSAGGAYRCPKP